MVVTSELVGKDKWTTCIYVLAKIQTCDLLIIK